MTAEGLGGTKSWSVGAEGGTFCGEALTGEYGRLTGECKDEPNSPCEKEGGGEACVRLKVLNEGEPVEPGSEEEKEWHGPGGDEQGTALCDWHPRPLSKGNPDWDCVDPTGQAGKDYPQGSSNANACRDISEAGLGLGESLSFQTMATSWSTGDHASVEVTVSCNRCCLLWFWVPFF